jgi:RHS repeat-associated protein
MQPLEVSFALADSGQYQVLLDAAAPQVLAMLDEAEGVSLLFDEPVVPAVGMELDSSITVTRAGAPVEGSTTRVSPWQLAWRPSESSAWILGGEYRVSIAGLVELGPEQKPVSTNLLPVTFTHLASGSERILVATQPPETPPRASSAFGNTTLFQGRLWVPELGLYYYRARWYDPMLGDFLERDPLGPVDSPNLYQALGRNPVNITDPQGLYEKDFHFYAVYYLARAAGFAPADARLLAWSSQYVDDYEHTQPLTANFSTLGGFHFLSPTQVAKNITRRSAGHGEVVSVVEQVASQEPVEPENRIALANLNRAIAVQGSRSRKLIALGIALHSWADTFSHAGFTGTPDPRNQRPGWHGRKPLIRRPIGELTRIGHGAAGNWPDWPYWDEESVQKAMKAAESIYRQLASFAGAFGFSRDEVRPWDQRLTNRLEGLFKYEGDEEARAANWERAISEDFRWEYGREYVHYEKKNYYDKVPNVLREFGDLVEEQRRFVMQLYGWQLYGLVY